MDKRKIIVVSLAALLLVAFAATPQIQRGGKKNRICAVCKKNKPVSDYSRDSKKCKACVKTAQKLSEKERNARETAKKENESVRVSKGESVNLGLPSGTLWADRNVGANTPEEYGNYYAWGETKAKKGGQTIDWSTYKWSGIYYYTMKKYCTNSKEGYKGFVDNKTELELADDAANVYWGNGWRTPTLAQFEELIKECTWTWKSYKGIMGYEVKGKNGNFIFLPAAGCRCDSKVRPDGEGEGGDYWSRSLCIDGPSDAYYLDFYENKHYECNFGGRFAGRCIRPVRMKK